MKRKALSLIFILCLVLPILVVIPPMVCATPGPETVYFYPIPAVIDYGTPLSVSWHAIDWATGYDYDVVKWEGEIGCSVQTTILDASTAETGFIIPAQTTGKYLVIKARPKNETVTNPYFSKIIMLGHEVSYPVGVRYIPVNSINGTIIVSDTEILTTRKQTSFYHSKNYAAVLCSPNTDDGTYIVAEVFISDKGRWIPFSGNDIVFTASMYSAYYEIINNLKVGDIIDFKGAYLATNTILGQAYAIVNGGIPIVNVPKDITPSNEKVTTTADGTAFRGFTEKTTVETALSYFEQDNSYLQIKDADGNILEGNDIIGTGCTVNLVVNEAVKASYTIIVTGDLSGNGMISSSDYMKLRAVLKAQSFLTGTFEYAADINNDGSITATDYLLLRGYLKGDIDIF